MMSKSIRQAARGFPDEIKLLFFFDDGSLFSEGRRPGLLPGGRTFPHADVYHSVRPTAIKTQLKKPQDRQLNELAFMISSETDPSSTHCNFSAHPRGLCLQFSRFAGEKFLRRRRPDDGRSTHRPRGPAVERRRFFPVRRLGRTGIIQERPRAPAGR